MKPNKKEKMMSFKITKEEYIWLLKEASRRGWSMSEILRQGMQCYKKIKQGGE